MAQDIASSVDPRHISALDAHITFLASEGETAWFPELASAFARQSRLVVGAEAESEMQIIDARRLGAELRLLEADVVAILDPAAARVFAQSESDAIHVIYAFEPTVEMHRHLSASPAIIVRNREAARRIAVQGPTSARVHYLPRAFPIAMPAQSSDPRAELDIPEDFRDRILIVHVGGSHFDARGDIALNVLGRLGDDAFLVFADGGEFRALRGLARRRGLDQSVLWREGLSAQERTQWMAAASCTLIPSTRGEAAFDALQSLAVGTPVVGINAPAMDEVLIDGQTGLLAAVADDDAGLAARVRMIISQPLVRDRFVAASRPAARRFRPEEVKRSFSILARELVPSLPSAEGDQGEEPLRFEELDRNSLLEWRAFADEHPKATPFHTAAWQNFEEAIHPGDDESLLLVKGDEVLAVLPLRRDAIERDLLHSGVHGPSGPLFANDLTPAERARCAVALEARLASRLGRMGIRRIVTESLEATPGISPQRRFYDRARVRAAASSPASSVRKLSASDCDAAHALLRFEAHRAGREAPPHEFLPALFRALGSQMAAFVIGPKEAPQALAIALFDKERAYLIESAVGPDGHEEDDSTALFIALEQESRDRGLQEIILGETVRSSSEDLTLSPERRRWQPFAHDVMETAYYLRRR